MRSLTPPGSLFPAFFPPRYVPSPSDRVWGGRRRGATVGSEPGEAEMGVVEKLQAPKEGKMLEKTKKEVTRTYNPLVLFDDLRADFEQLWEKPWLPLTFRHFRTEKVTPWTPKMDVFEKNGELIVKADLPGL